MAVPKLLKRVYCVVRKEDATSSAKAAAIALSAGADDFDGFAAVLDHGSAKTFEKGILRRPQRGCDLFGEGRTVAHHDNVDIRTVALQIEIADISTHRVGVDTPGISHGADFY